MTRFSYTALLTILLSLPNWGGLGKSLAAIKLPQLFQSGMVLQRNQPIPVWGTADKGETVTITFKGKTYTTTASATDGTWRIDLPKQKACAKPLTMTVSGTVSPSASTTPSSVSCNMLQDTGEDKITLSDILIGDVWLVSGQSNIDCTIERVYPQYGKAIDDYQNDNIRLFQVPTSYIIERQHDVKTTSWKHCNKQNAWKFSAVGYFLGQLMYSPSPSLPHREEGVPQGVIQASLGGTDIQSWMDIDSLRNYPGPYYTNYLLYTDKQYVEAQTRANNRANDVWFTALNQTDPGCGQYEKADYDDSQWHKYSQYDNNQWAKQNGKPIIGSMWLRQHIKVDAAHAGMAATMNLGTFHDMDYTYVNGKQVGVTYYQYPPRRYTIPAGLLHEGDNVITIRLICKSGMANFYKDKPHNIVFCNVLQNNATTAPSSSPEVINDTIQTSTDWLIQTGAVMPEGPLGGKLNTQNQASMLYNGMLYPLAPFAISGVVWYQGENNTNRPQEYGTMLKKLTGNWRTLWNSPTLPFNIVQLANYMEPTEQPMDGGWPALREQQRLFTDSDPYSTLTIGIDLGEASDIHPLRKRELTERIALALQNQVFGKKNPLSPEPVSCRSSLLAFQRKNVPSVSTAPSSASCNMLQDTSQDKITLIMTQPLQPCTDLHEFEVKGSDGKYHNAKASTDGNTVTVTIPDGITSPVAVRYAWKNNPAKANLVGKSGLPASPFQIEVK